MPHSRQDEIEAFFTAARETMRGQIATLQSMMDTFQSLQMTAWFKTVRDPRKRRLSGMPEVRRLRSMMARYIQELCLDAAPPEGRSPPPVVCDPNAEAALFDDVPLDPGAARTESLFVFDARSPRLGGPSTVGPEQHPDRNDPSEGWDDPPCGGPVNALQPKDNGPGPDRPEA